MTSEAKALKIKGFRTHNRSLTAVCVGLLIFLLAWPAVLQAQYTYYSSNGTVTITKYTGYGGYVTIPATLGGLPVTRIGDNAFESTSVVIVKIPDSVTEIGQEAFGFCTGLTSVTIPNNVSAIGSGAFWGCPSLTSIVIPTGVTCIDRSTFSGCTNLSNVTLPGSVTKISDYAFVGCEALAEIALPDSLMSIGYGVFSRCTTLSNIFLPAGVVSVMGGAFSGCDHLTTINVDPSNFLYRSVDGVLFNKNVTTLVQYPGGKRGEYLIPDTVTQIGAQAFSDSAGLTNIVMPGSVTFIGDNAFGGSRGLRSIDIPATVVGIGTRAFSTTSLTAINVDPANRYFASADGVLFNKPMSRLLQFPGAKAGNYVIPNSVLTFAIGAMDNSTNMTGVMLPTLISTIDRFLFWSCTALTNVVIPNSIGRIEEGAFAECSSLQTVTLPNELATISEYVFGSCTNLRSINIPSTVTSIESDAFIDCSRLVDITIPSSVTNIGDGAFAFCTSLTNIAIPASVRSIGGFAFRTSGLISFTFPDGFTWIQRGLFCECFYLQKVIVPNSVTRVESVAFWSCPSLAGIYFLGNAPRADPDALQSPTISYYLPGTSGWGSIFGGRPTAIWQLAHPVILNNTADFGIRDNHFGFRISWAKNAAAVVEAATNLANPTWVPLSTNLISNGTRYFSDPGPANLAARLYRVRKL